MKLSKLKKAIISAGLALSMITSVASATSVKDYPRVAVMNFGNKAITSKGFRDQDFAMATEYAIYQLSASNWFDLIDYEELNTIAQMHNINNSGLVDPSTIVAMGQFAGAEYMIVGNVTGLTLKENTVGLQANKAKAGVGEHVVNASVAVRIVDIKTGRIMGAGIGKGSSTSTMTEIGFIKEKLVERMTSRSTTRDVTNILIDEYNRNKTSRNESEKNRNSDSSHQDYSSGASASENTNSSYGANQNYSDQYGNQANSNGAANANANSNRNLNDSSYTNGNSSSERVLTDNSGSSANSSYYDNASDSGYAKGDANQSENYNSSYNENVHNNESMNTSNSSSNSSSYNRNTSDSTVNKANNTETNTTDDRYYTMVKEQEFYGITIGTKQVSEIQVLNAISKAIRDAFYGKMGLLTTLNNGKQLDIKTGF